MTLPAGASAVRVALDARIPAGQWGGVQQVAQGLASGFAELDEAFELTFLAYEDARDWLGPSLGRKVRHVAVGRSFARSGARRAYDAVKARSGTLARLVELPAALLGSRVTVLPKSDGLVESLGVDLVHFLTPQAWRTEMKSIYQPHDLLHVHVPESFSAAHRAYRDHAYRAFSAQAAVVATMTEWGRQDLSNELGLPASKIAVIPWAPVLGADGSSGPGVRPPGDLPSRFLFYPAQTWPHKNHLALLDAIADARARGTDVSLICTGRQTDHYQEIARRVEELGLGAAVRFLGYVDDAAMRWLYEEAVGLIYPSRFEGWGLPVVEAFASGLPVACSRSAVLPEVAGGAALLFDADDRSELAAAIDRLVGDSVLRDSLRERGRRRVGAWSWKETARTFVALYRQVAGQTLSEEDRLRLAPPTLLP